MLDWGFLTKGTNMPTYQELQAQIEELKAQAEKVRQDEIAEARKQIRQLMQENHIGINDLLNEKKQAGGSKKTKAVDAKYRDPDSGSTWTGRGRAPKWLNGRNKEEFLIK